MGLTMASVLRQRFGAFRRTVLPTVSQHPVHSPSITAKRFIGGHGGDDAEETFKWRNVTIACVIGLIPMMFNTLSGDEEHHHGDERPGQMDYLNLMTEIISYLATNSPNQFEQHISQISGCKEST